MNLNLGPKNKTKLYRLAGAICYIELACVVPLSGGETVYIKVTFRQNFRQNFYAQGHGIRVSSALLDVDIKQKFSKSAVVVFHFSGKLMDHMEPLIIDWL